MGEQSIATILGVSGGVQVAGVLLSKFLGKGIEAAGEGVFALTRPERSMKRIVVLTVAVAVASTGWLMAQSPKKPPTQKVRDASELRARTVDERELAALFDADGKSVLDGRAAVIEPESPMPPSPFREPPTRQEQVRSEVCGSDFVFSGHLQGTKTLLNKSETQLFTLGTISVEQWLSPSTGRQTLEVGWSGGAVEFEGRKIETDAGAQAEIGQAYLFFLKKVPRGQAYAARGFLKFEAGKISDGRSVGILKTATGEVESLLAEVRAAARQCDRGER